MELYLQQGSQMQGLGRSISQMHPGSKIILSPKDFQSETKLIDYAKSINGIGGKVLLDPQLYLQSLGKEAAKTPVTDYWGSTNDLKGLVSKVVYLNQKIGSESVILPSPFIKEVNAKILDTLRIIVDAAQGAQNIRFLTICLSSEFFRSQTQYNRLCKFLENIDAPGIYLLPERSDGDYLTDDPVWLHRLLEFCADLKMSGKMILVGYASHQLLPLASVAVDAMATGKNRSTRIFWMDSFRKKEEGDLGFAHPKPSYYCPNALTEFSLKYLDLASKGDVLELMKPQGFLVSPAVERLLSSKSPLSCQYTLQDGYLNYYNLLAQQCKMASKGDSFKTRIEWQNTLINSTDELLTILHKNQVRGLLKDFAKFVGVARSALQALEETRGDNLALSSDIFAVKSK